MPPVRPARSNFRWVVAAILFAATLVNYADRQILALLKPILDRNLGWSNEQYGLVNSAFQATYALSYLAFGWFIDRCGIKLGYAVSIALWSLAEAWHGFVHGTRGFLAARFALGAGEGGSFPACIKAVAHWFPPRERALASSIFNSGANVGPILAPAIVPWIAARFGWRAAFFAAGAAGLVWLAFWLPFYSEPEASRRVSQAELDLIAGGAGEGDRDRRLPWLALFRLRPTRAYLLLKFLTDPISWFWLIWLPDIFKKTRGFDLGRSWIYLVAIYALSLLLSNLGGWFSGHLMRRGWPVTRARKTALFAFALCVTPVFLALRADPWVAVLLIGLALGAHHAWATCFYAITSDIFPKTAVAAVAGMGGMAGSIGGMIFPAVAGWILDRHRSLPGGEGAGYAILFSICGGAYLVAFAIFHLMVPRFDRTAIEEASRYRERPGAKAGLRS